jgi:MarR family transcriptional regulator, organic hydroperoxide resistance regulator
MFTARPFASPEAQRLLELLKTLFGSTFRQFLWRNAAELELTYAQAQVLFYVAQHPDCHMGQVAKTFNVTLSAITQIVDRLVQKRFLTRSSKPADRRVYILELTTEGKALVQELETLQVEVLEPVLQRLSARDRNHLINGLEKFVEAVTDGPQEGTGKPLQGSRQTKQYSMK